MKHRFGPLRNMQATCGGCGKDYNVFDPQVSGECPGGAQAPQVACECGSEKVGSPNHSSWCPKDLGKAVRQSAFLMLGDGRAIRLLPQTIQLPMVFYSRPRDIRHLCPLCPKDLPEAMTALAQDLERGWSLDLKAGGK